MRATRLFQEGKNCWKIAHCNQAAFIIDGKDYFKALYQAIPDTQSHFIILSWDIMSQFQLVREQQDIGTLPTALGELLNVVVSENENVEGYILNWDYSLLLVSDRELMPSLRFNWNTDTSLHFEQDNQIPFGGCHHQKVVVIDDLLAFCGGLDITRGRWDTSEHLTNNPYRTEQGSSTPRPHHDMQMAVSGPIAQSLGDMARERWTGAGNDPIRPALERESTLWPPFLRVDMADVEVALSRTLPDESGNGVYEVEQLFLDTIEQAEDYIYIENQYLSADCIVAAIEASLSRESGPDIVFVTPLETDGWVSQQTMDQQRAWLIERLKAADHHGRFQAYFPRITRHNEVALNVHAKVMIADDQFVRIGSGNLSNRSMRLDSECDLSVFETERDDVMGAIEHLRNRLLAEHLDVPVQVVTQAIAQHSSLIPAVESLRERNNAVDKARNLEPLPTERKARSRPLPGSPDIFDPMEPIDPRRLLNSLGKAAELTPPPPAAKRGMWAWIGLVVFCVGLSLLWKWGPLAEWANPEALKGMVESINELPMAPLLAFCLLVVACIMMVPLTLLAVLSALLFGLVEGFLLVFFSSMASAFISYCIGAWVGRESLAALAGERFNQVSRKLAQHGVLSVAAIRLVPVAPFTIVNLVAGASHIKLKDFMVGSAIAMAPALFAIILLVDQFRVSLETTNFDQILMRIGIVIMVILGSYLVIGRAIKYIRGSGASSKG